MDTSMQDSLRFERFLDWDALQKKPASERIQVLEGALAKSIKYSAELARLIESAINSSGNESSIAESDVFSTDTLRKWIKEVDDLASEHLNFELLVGVQGNTGAGKSALLSALLNTRDILPSNCAAAATATVCKVAYNHSDDPEKAYHAEIHYRTLESVKQELDDLFEYIKKRDRLLEQSNSGTGVEENDYGDDDAARAQEIEDLNVYISLVAKKVQHVWGYTSEQLGSGSVSTADLLAKSDPAAKRLGTIDTIFGSKHEEFAERVKPFLDSTPKVVKAKPRQGAPTREMAAWPLIDHVNIWLKCPLLKGGIVLVDLPGLSDVVEGRSAVARQYYKQLAVAVVVAPAIRAADEQKTVQLMSENQEINLRMSGKFDDRSFCIVISKTDEGMNWGEANRAFRDEGRDEALERINEFEAKMKECNEAIKEAKVQTRSLQKQLKGKEKEERRTTKSKIRDHKKRKNAWSKDLIFCRRETKGLRGAAFHAAVQSRSNLHVKRLNEYLQERHTAFLSQCPDAPKHFSAPRIFPVSVKAYWGLGDGKENMVEGFPTTAYTGIPALAKWLDEATIPQRERHAYSVLHRLDCLRHNIQTWSDDECSMNKIQFSEQQLKEMILDPVYHEIQKNLIKFETKLKNKVSKNDPLRKGKTTAALKECGEHCAARVHRWVFKEPDNQKSATKLHAHTFRAIIKREGGEFVSHSGGFKKRYCWMEDMATAFKIHIAGVWIETFHNAIPKMEKDARLEVDKIWEKGMEILNRDLVKHFEGQKSYLAKEALTLSAVKEEVKDLVGQALLDISARSTEIHTDLAESLQKKWRKGFKDALAERGRGSMGRRHTILQKFAKDKGHVMYREAVADMKAQLQKQIKQLPEILNKAWEHGLNKLQTQLALITNNVIKAENRDGEEFQRAEGDKVLLQQRVRELLMKWQASFIMADVGVDQIDETEIPTVYQAPEDNLDEEDDDVVMEEISDSESETENKALAVKIKAERKD
ncbi:hypothetical protein B0T22DRAFT_470765 [Podospora appendiculata]|uniref:Dynamin N-terminal domain-containing protein n=1 Tax=Podospora appendiculata TaxID=314037 RepID=A0AAE0X0R4_9PEZI|nr:hypothetical protein B0T22DRAFT_470765 [Podospora appendiculata]